MPRPLRIEYEGACYHVINRGNYRRNLFKEKGSAEAFVRTLGEAAVRFGWEIHAYAVMSTHFHLALRLGEPNLSEGMKWLQGAWIRRYNGYRRLMGRPFQGRYKGLLVEPGRTFGKVCHYIHLNPVRAGLVPPAEAAAYPWSSLARLGAKERPKWLRPEGALAAAGSLPDTRAGWRQYGNHLVFLATDAEAGRELVAARMSRGWCVGSREFKQEMQAEVKERGAQLERFAGLEPDEVRAERIAVWEEKLNALAVAAGIAPAELPATKSHPSKVLLAAALKQSTSVSNGWLARRLGMGAPASVSQFVRRLRLSTHGPGDIEHLLSRVKT